MNGSPALRVEALRTEFATAEGSLPVVDGVDFSLARGEVLGIVGESGSGKSVTAYSILGLVEPPGRVVGGRVLLGDTDLLTLTRDELTAVRGARLSMIFQDPMMSLNPVLRIDTQVIEALRAHARMTAGDARQRAAEALARVGIAEPEERLRSYPHELSGGMRQRVSIAIAMLHRPDVIVADEPTTALDVTIQAQILSEMQALCTSSGTALLWITHDLSVVASFADRVCVMYAGRIVESGPVDAVIGNPLHPYTRGLLDSVPALAAEGRRLVPIPGIPLAPAELDGGCAFRHRCPRASALCAVAPVETYPAPDRSLRCHHPLDRDAEAST
ncbi:MAG: ABC transporter ATP-binding protein [Betaproteobacteria bacterium PRO3]|nr:ABC transporter ATP-binding protein [Betaproteobacteria bacterium PRO3]